MAAGKRIGALCGERIARCTLELGGKSAAIVLDDYDVTTLQAAISIPTRMLCGQVCSALTRVIVPRARHDEVVDALAADFAAMKVGDPFDAATELGPLSMERQRERVERPSCSIRSLRI